MSRKFRRAQQKKQQKSRPFEHPAFVAGLQQAQRGNLQQAEQCFRQVLQQVPDHEDSLFNLGLVFQNTSRIEEAVGAYQRVIQVNRKYIDAYINLGLMLERLGKFSDALQVYYQATKIKPGYISYYNLAGPLYQLRKYKDAEIALRESIKYNPDFAQSHLNLATILKELNRLDEAEVECKEAVRLAPNIVDTHFNLGRIYDLQNNSEEAIKSYERALELDPRHEKTQACLFYRKLHACDWQGVEELGPKLDALTDELISRQRCPGITGFTQIARCDDPARNLEITKAWSEDAKRKVAREKPDFPFAGRKKDKDKITVGFLSADFRAHAFGHITKYLFETIDRDRFRVIAYSTAADKSDVREYYRRTADEFVEIHNMSDAEAAQKIYDDEVDILCECTCYTAGARIEIAAMRPAPIQVNLWGFVGSTGADFLDYIIVDEVVVPKEHQPYYTEKLVTLPNSLQINHRNEKISEGKFTRKDFGLPKTGFVFCSFNQSYKIEPVMFSIWMELLKEVPDSILWLRTTEKLAKANLLNTAAESGINKDRIIFADKLMDRAEYYRRIQLADLALDTRVYNGGSTTMDALWAGVPVITLLGKHYASRMSSGLINAAGRPELITNDMQEYKNLALKFANNPDELQKTKDKLWQQRQTCPLFDTERYARNLEKAFEKMWKRYLSGETPDSFEVVE